MSVYAAMSNLMPVLALGGANALLAVAVPGYARWFVNRYRAEGEVRQYAQAMFVDRQLFRTGARNGILLLVSRFERQVEVLADIGFRGRVNERDWRTVAHAVTPLLNERRCGDAVRRGLEELEELLVAKGFMGAEGASDELPNPPIQERGA